MRIFLTGATGFIGRHLRKALVADGHQVVGLARHPQPEEQGVTWVSGDIQEVDSLIEGMQGCQAVVHLVGIIRESKRQTFAQVHVQGTEYVIAAMQRLGITRLLHMSALGAGPKQPTEYYRTKWQAEELVRATGLDYTIFRPSLVFGPGDGITSLLIQQLRLYPVIPIIGAGDYLFAPISVHAVCAAFIQALRLDGPTTAKTFEICGPQVLTFTEIIDTLAAYLRIRKPRIHISPRVMSALIRLGRELHLPLPISQDEMTMLLLGNVCSDESARKVFNLPQITLAEGIEEYARKKR